MIEVKFCILIFFSIVMIRKFDPSFYLNLKIVRIDGGKIIGETLDDHFAFRGIPYAESPIGDLRFAPPKRFSQKWHGIRKFMNYSNICAQYDHFGYQYEGSEDCLTLNVFVPKFVAYADKAAPVIFFIHGGAFMYGGSNVYGPENIMKHQNMILVTVNYRLGVLGFLSTEDENIPGNFGLKDQVEALKWVQRNIKSFNGDPGKVTLSGFSAGGASVQLHYMSQLSKGLFNNGISHSGVALNPWVMDGDARKKANAIASFMNCSNDPTKMIKCLRSKPTKDLVMLISKFQPFLYNPFSPLGVVVERYSQSDSAFLTEHPLNLLQSGNVAKLPWIASLTQDEGLYPAAEFYNDTCLKTINDNWIELAPFLLDFNKTVTDSNTKLDISRKIRSFYFGNQEIGKQNFGKLVQMMSDRLYNYNAKEALKLHSRVAPTYFYNFHYQTEASIAKDFSKQEKYLGVAHGDDVFLIYYNPSSRDQLSYSKDEKIIGNQLIKMYHNFSLSGGDAFYYGDLNVLPVKPSMIKCLEIFSQTNYSITTKGEDFANSNFWDELYKQERW